MPRLRGIRPGSLSEDRLWRVVDPPIPAMLHGEWRLTKLTMSLALDECEGDWRSGWRDYRRFKRQGGG